MFMQKQLPILYFFPQQTPDYECNSHIACWEVNSEIKATVQFGYSMGQKNSVICPFGKKALYKIQIRRQYLVIIAQESESISQTYKTSLKCSFSVKQYKQTATAQNGEVSAGSSFHIKLKLCFQFKDHLKQPIQFKISETPQPQVEQFIQDLGKLCFQQQDFHHRFKPQKIQYTNQNYTLLRAKDLKKKLDVVVKAYRKNNIENQIWLEYSLVNSVALMSKVNVLQNCGCFQTLNSVYMVFETFDYFLEGYANRISQKYRGGFEGGHVRKVTEVLEVMKTVVETLQLLHQNGYSMNGMFTETNIVFRQNRGNFYTMLNPFSNLLYAGNYFDHKEKLQQKIAHFQQRASALQILPVDLFQVSFWRRLNKDDYFQYLKKSDIYGLGNVLHLLLFNQSIFGKFEKDQIHTNNLNERLKLSSQLQQLQISHPELYNLFYRMIERQQSQRISLGQLKYKIEQILDREIIKPKTTQEIHLFSQTNLYQNGSVTNNKQCGQAQKIHAQNGQKWLQTDRSELSQRMSPSKRIKREYD